MNFGSFLVLLKLAMDSGFTVSPKTNGPTTPTVDDTFGVKPTCGPGFYASFNTSTDSWECVRIPGGR